MSAGAQVLSVRMQAGQYRAQVRVPGHADPGTPPALRLCHGGAPLAASAPCHLDGEDWELRAALPAHLLGEGVQALHLTEGAQGTVLHALTISTGAPLPGDIAAELALLRSEMDIVKAALRRLIAAQAGR